MYNKSILSQGSSTGPKRLGVSLRGPVPGADLDCSSNESDENSLGRSGEGFPCQGILQGVSRI